MERCGISIDGGGERESAEVRKAVALFGIRMLSSQPDRDAGRSEIPEAPRFAGRLSYQLLTFASAKIHRRTSIPYRDPDLCLSDPPPIILSTYILLSHSE